MRGTTVAAVGVKISHTKNSGSCDRRTTLNNSDDSLVKRPKLATRAMCAQKYCVVVATLGQNSS